MIMIKIEKNVPIPSHRGKYPFRDMKVGESFYYDNGTSNYQCLYNASRIFCIREKIDWKFTVRKEGEGARIWRTK